MFQIHLHQGEACNENSVYGIENIKLVYLVGE